MAVRGHVAGLFLVLLSAIALSEACIYKFGTAPDSLSPPHGGSSWNHALDGDDWDGVDALGNPWVCMSGTRQSPINVPPLSTLDNPAHAVPFELRTRWNYSDLVSNGSNVEVINNGHAIQIEWLYDYQSDVKIAVPASWTNATKVTSVLNMTGSENHTYVTAKPAQFHFHTTSEHTFNGRYFPLEMHIVHKITDLPGCAAGCFSVTGIMFELVASPDNHLLDAIWDAMPDRQGVINYLPAGKKIQLNDLLPMTSHRHYVTYEGSLTTPPCTEGLLWHVMLTPQKISMAQWRKYKSAVSFKDCVLNNGTDPAHAHHHHRLSSRRLLSEEPTGNPNDWNCTLAGYGTNFRAFQKTNGRTVKMLHM